MKQPWTKRAAASKALLATLLTLGLVAAPLFDLVSDGAAGADTATTGFYLDLGGSASVGMQPTSDNPHGEPTDEGYANDVVAYEAARGVNVDLTELGCPGESTATMINGFDDCYHAHDSQLTDAMEFLQSHYDDEGIVTIDIGFNNLRHCISTQALNAACVKTQINEVSEQLPTILEGLESAAGPGVTFVGLSHYNPFLADALLGTAGEQFALNSDLAVGRLNAALQSVYTHFGIAMALVGDAFDAHDVERVHLVGVGTMPDNVEHVCELTWMCESPPYGPNIHPNDAGYAAIASAIESVLVAPW